jgi:hypothetical protein
VHDSSATKPPVATFSGSSVSFGAVDCGSIPTTMALTITNSGGSPLHVSAI